MADLFSQLVADPYPWPFDGQWNSDDTALLLLGFQNETIEALHAQAATEVAAQLVAAADACGLLVVASRKGRATDAPMTENQRSAFAEACPVPDTHGWQLSHHLGLKPETPIWDHAGDNAFYGTELESLLRARGVRNLLICGLPTDGLVHATQRNANDMGFECLAVSDACRGTTEERHAGQLRITTFGNGLFGAVATSAAVLQSILPK